MFAIIQTPPKQIKLQQHQQIFVQKLHLNEADTFTFDKLLFLPPHSVKVP
ncbi:bL21 family ribosomal protein, partial [Staphylococcus aureus]